jgi:hypothetical protein
MKQIYMARFFAFAFVCCVAQGSSVASDAVPQMFPHGVVLLQLPHMQVARNVTTMPPAKSVVAAIGLNASTSGSERQSRIHFMCSAAQPHPHQVVLLGVQVNIKHWIPTPLVQELSRVVDRMRMRSMSSDPGMLARSTNTSIPAAMTPEEAGDPCVLGLTKFAWAFLLTGMSMALVFMCVPFLLCISRRRPPGESIFDGVCMGTTQPDAAVAPRLVFSTPGQQPMPYSEPK